MRGSDYTVDIPNYTIGPDAISALQRIAGHYGDKALIVGGKTALAKSQEKIVQALTRHGGIDFHVRWYGGEVSHENIGTLIGEAQKNRSNLIIGVGGGKAIDTAKGLAEKLKLPIITIPTIASTCAAATALSVIYESNGEFAEILHMAHSPVHIFMDTTIIASSPWQFQWAGIGDAMAKYYESKVATRNKNISHSVQMALQISQLCAEPALKYGIKAVSDNKAGIDSPDLREVMLNNIVSTGYASLLVGLDNNSAAAHGLYYGMTALPEIEENHLHGEVVAYGILILLMMDNDKDEVRRLYPFYKEIGFPTCLGDLNLNRGDISDAVVEKALASPSMGTMPYNVTREMLLEAIDNLEGFKRSGPVRP
jgi:glycerol dehydrogenase-like iron-containing ADH family enzyme